MLGRKENEILESQGVIEHHTDMKYYVCISAYDLEGDVNRDDTFASKKIYDIEVRECNRQAFTIRGESIEIGPVIVRKETYDSLEAYILYNKLKNKYVNNKKDNRQGKGPC